MKNYLFFGVFLLCIILAGCTAHDIPDPQPYSNNHTTNKILKEPLYPIAVSNKYGSYSGRVQAEWITKGQMRLLNDFSYTDPEGIKWLASKGSVVNGASIPSSLWGFIGSPFSGEYRDASVIHDVACVERKRSWEMVHKAFYNGMKASGVSSTLAKIMYAAVYNFGPRWEADGSVSRDMRIMLSTDKIEQLKLLIKQSEANNSGMTLEQIQNFR